jgi:acyl-CoA-binding protein
MSVYVACTFMFPLSLKIEWLRDITHAIDEISRQNLETRRLSLLSSANNAKAAAAAVAASTAVSTTTSTSTSTTTSTFTSTSTSTPSTTSQVKTDTAAAAAGPVSSEGGIETSSKTGGKSHGRLRRLSFSRSPSTSPAVTSQPSPFPDAATESNNNISGGGDAAMGALSLAMPASLAAEVHGSPLLTNAQAVSVDEDGQVIDSDSDNDEDSDSEGEDLGDDIEEDKGEKGTDKGRPRGNSSAELADGVSDADLQAMFLRGVMFGKPILASEDDAIEASDEDKLLMYGYFKQSTQGDCNTPEPENTEGSVEHEKWMAWSNTRSLSARQAMLEFMAVLDRLAPGWLGFT